MLLLPTGSETLTEGQSDDKPIVLQGVKSVDFACMLWMFYNELVSLAPFKIYWKGVLIKLGQKIF